MGLSIIVNGQEKILANLPSSATLAEVIRELALKGDRIAVEHNGNIAQRPTWDQVSIASGDRLEIVHFVGGGSRSRCARRMKEGNETIPGERNESGAIWPAAVFGLV